MAINIDADLVHLPFGDRQLYGSSFPEGLAVAHSNIVGDLSGGGISVLVRADGGFLYRIELIRGHIDIDVAEDWSLRIAHDWATAKSGLGTGAFDLEYNMFRSVGAGGDVHLDMLDRINSERRFPIGRLDDILLQTLMLFTIPTNTNTRIYDIDVLLTYWRKEALYRPGFLQHFFGEVGLAGGTSSAG